MQRRSAVSYEKSWKILWEDDSYLKPYMGDDALLHSFASDEDEEDYTTMIYKEELMRDLMNIEDLSHLAKICDDSQTISDITRFENMTDREKIVANGNVVDEGLGAVHQNKKDKQLRVSFANVATRVIKNVNENYFGAYSSFSIHREMIGDKVRTDAYRRAILDNPSLVKQATIMDVGCGTRILSVRVPQRPMVRVDKRGYYHCNESSRGIAFKEGNTVFLLDKPDFYYFISGEINQYKKGQRLMIYVLALRLPTVRFIVPSNRRF